MNLTTYFITFAAILGFCAAEPISLPPATANTTFWPSSSNETLPRNATVTAPDARQKEPPPPDSGKHHVCDGRRSTFNGQTSDGSPRAANCHELARRVAADGVWVVRDSVSGLQLLAAHETCAFRVAALNLYRYEKNASSSARAAKRSLSFQIGTRNIIALIQRGIRRFERRGRVGVWGIIRCEGTTYGDREVVWGVYHSPGRGTRPGPLGDIILGIAGAIPNDAGTRYSHSTGTRHGSR